MGVGAQNNTGRGFDERAGEASRTENLFFVEIDFQISHFRSKSPNLSEIEDVCAYFCNTNWL